MLNKGQVFQVYLNSKNNENLIYAETALEILYHINKQRDNNKRNQYSSLKDYNHVNYIGKYFTFFKFVDFIIKCAKSVFGGSNQNELDSNELMEAEMMCLLLERLELSKGFNNLEKKTHRPHTSKMTLLPSKGIIR